MTEKTVANVAYKRIRNDLLKGRLGPQSRLRVNELQQRYDLGISPLREALLRLSADGLVVAEGQKGFAVAAVTLAELADLTKTRIQIESIALTDAIAQGDETWEARVMGAFHLLSRTPMPTDSQDQERLDLWELRHRAFHDALISGCNSAWLMRIHSQLMDHSERYRLARMFDHSAQAPQTRDTMGEHQALMNAVLNRKTDLACQLIREHLAQTEAAAARALRQATVSRSES